MMRDQKPALLLLDLMMPDLNGWDVYRAVKTDETLADMPVIIITAKSSETQPRVIADLPPANDYIVKPFDVEQIIRSVQKIL
jgi:two-component system alkaline phosphatase synthesis response regulator PhoP